MHDITNQAKIIEFLNLTWYLLHLLSHIQDRKWEKIYFLHFLLTVILPLHYLSSVVSSFLHSLYLLIFLLNFTFSASLNARPLNPFFTISCLSSVVLLRCLGATGDV